MSKKRIVFLIVAAIVLLIWLSTRTCKAEGITDDDGQWIPPDWAIDGFESATEPPEPSGSSLLVPEGSGVRSDSDLQKALLSYDLGYFAFNYNGGNFNYCLLVSSYTGSVAGRPWAFVTRRDLNTDPQSFISYVTLLQTSSSFMNRTVAVDGAGIYYTFKDTPSVDLNSDNTISYGFKIPIQVTYTSPDGVTSQDLGITQSMFLNIPVTVLVELHTKNNNMFQYSYSFTFADLSNLNFELPLTDIYDDDFLDYVNFSVIVNYDWANNPFYNAVNVYKSSHPEISLGTFGTLTYKASSSVSYMRTVSSSEEGKTRGFIGKLIRSIFLPDSEELVAIINQHLPEVEEGSTEATFINFFNQLFRSLVHEPGDAVLTLPEFKLTLKGIEYTIWDRYVFNLTDFFQQEKMQTFLAAIRTFTGLVLVCGFINSMIEMVAKVMGFNLSKGVEDKNGG